MSAFFVRISFQLAIKAVEFRKKLHSSASFPPCSLNFSVSMRSDSRQNSSFKIASTKFVAFDNNAVMLLWYPKLEF